MRTQSQYEKIYQDTVKHNEFLAAAEKQGWSHEAILGVFIERDKIMLDKIIDLQTLLRSGPPKPP